MYKYNRIKELREDKDLTLEQLAKTLGEHTTTYRRWESGEREMPTHVIIKLCKYYKISADYILGLTDTP